MRQVTACGTPDCAVIQALHMQAAYNNADEQIQADSAEMQPIKDELSRLEDRNNQLQGYGLDNMSAEELSGLIHGLTQVSTA